MATLEHIEERVFKPNREDVKSILKKDGILRYVVYFFCVVSFVGSIIILTGIDIKILNNYDIDFLTRVSFVISLAVMGGIGMSRDREDKKNENITKNNEDSKYLLNIGYEAQQLKGSALKTSKVKDNLIRPLLLDAEQLKRHMLIMATIGAGKTVFMKGMIEQHALLGGGGMAVDGKGTAEFAKEIYALFESVGRADDFIHLNFLDMDNTHTINPLLSGNATALFEILIALLEGEENEWKEKNKFFMENIIKLLVYKRDFEGAKIDFSLLSRYLVLEALVTEAIKYKDDIYKSTLLEDFVFYVSVVIGMGIDKFIHSDEDEIRAKVVSETQNQAQGIYDAGNSAQAWNGVVTNLKSKYGKVFNTQEPTISMFEAVQKNKFIFVTLPTMSSDTEPKKLGRLVLSLLKGVASEKAEKSIEPDIPFVCWFDEIGSYIIEGFGRLMSKSRALGISIIPIFQSPSQLDQIGKIVGSESVERREIIDVVGTHILMKNIHPETTEFYSKMLREKRYIDKDFVEKRTGIKGGVGAEAHFKVEKEQAIKHEEIISMNNGEMMVFSDGKMYKSISITERYLKEKGKKITYEGKNMFKKIPLTQFVPKKKFLKDMTQIFNELKKIKEVA